MRSGLFRRRNCSHFYKPPPSAARSLRCAINPHSMASHPHVSFSPSRPPPSRPPRAMTIKGGSHHQKPPYSAGTAGAPRPPIETHAPAPPKCPPCSQRPPPTPGVNKTPPLFPPLPPYVTPSIIA